ncbi:MAG: uracil-DNA glycosylase [Firmicutes bacterium]|nr:uracil-DNA glycosylase [Bacillota bacterium]
MENINREILRIAETFGKTPVFGSGKTKNAKILLLGEAPGAKEVETGRPFAGSAGKNLDEFLSILGLRREDIYITNTVKIRPCRVNEKTGRAVNRPPTKAEISAFSEVLRKEISAVSPEIIVTLGNTALQAVSGDDRKIGDCHGQVFRNGEFLIFPLYHPAAVIYRRSLKDEYVKDLEKLKDIVSQKI